MTGYGPRGFYGFQRVKGGHPTSETAVQGRNALDEQQVPREQGGGLRVPDRQVAIRVGAGPGCQLQRPAAQVQCGGALDQSSWGYDIPDAGYDGPGAGCDGPGAGCDGPAAAGTEHLVEV